MTSGATCVEMIGVCLILLINYVRKTPPPLITSLGLYDVTMLASCWNVHKSMTNANTARTYLNTLTNTHVIMSLCADQEVSSLSLFLHLYVFYKRYSLFAPISKNNDLSGWEPRAVMFHVMNRDIIYEHIHYNLQTRNREKCLHLLVWLYI